MSVTNNPTLQKEMDILIHPIVRELIVEFGKSKQEAIQLIKKSGVEEFLI